MSTYSECEACGREGGDVAVYMTERGDLCPVCYHARAGRYPAVVATVSQVPPDWRNGTPVPGAVFRARAQLDFGSRRSRTFSAVCQSEGEALAAIRDWTARPRPAGL